MKIVSGNIGLSVILIILAAGRSYAQNVRLASEVYPEHRLNPLRGEVYNKTYLQVKGNPYVIKDWKAGTLYLKNNDSIPGVDLRFDTYAQVPVIYINDLNRLILPEEDLVTAFTIYNNGRRMYFKRVSSDLGVKKMHSGYFLEVLYEGNMSFYKLYLNDIMPLRASEMPFIEEFVAKDSYYLYRGGIYELVRLGKNSVMNKFPGYRKEISRYIRTNSLKLKREKDFASVISYLDQFSQPEGE